MRSFKFFFISIVILFSVVTGIGLLFYPRVTVMRQVDIVGSSDSIRAYMSDMSQWKKWMIDSASEMKITSASALGKGATAIIGNSEAVITAVDSNRISIQWNSRNKNPEISELYLTPSGVLPNGTSVQWIFTQKLNWYPWERVGAILHEKVLGPPMEDDLKKLKKEIEGE